MQRTREGTDRKDCRCRDRRDQQCTCKEDGSGGIRHGIESGVTMVTQGFRDATLYHMSAKDTLHDVGITGITTFSTGIAFDILSRPVQALVRKFRGTVGISGCSEAAEGAGKSAGGTSDSPYIPDDEDIALEKMYDEQRQPCEEYEDYLGEIRKHIDEPAPKVTIKGGIKFFDDFNKELKNTNCNNKLDTLH